MGIYHCDTIVTAEDRHGLYPRDDGYSTGIIFNTRNTWVVLGGVGVCVCVRVNPSYRGSVTTVCIYHCGTIVTAEDRHGLCPRDDGYSTGIIFNTRAMGGQGRWDGVMTRQKKSRQTPTLESL